MNRPSWEFDRIRTCVDKCHKLAPKPLGHKLHITCFSWTRTNTSRSETWYATITPWSTLLPQKESNLRQQSQSLLYYRYTIGRSSCGASWSWTTFSGFSVLRIHLVCQSSQIRCPRWIRTTTFRFRIWRANHYTIEHCLWLVRDSNSRPWRS